MVVSVFPIQQVVALPSFSPFNPTFTFPATSEGLLRNMEKRKRDLLEIIYTDKSDAMNVQVNGVSFDFTLTKVGFLLYAKCISNNNHNNNRGGGL